MYADSILGSYLKRVEEAYYRSHGEMLEELAELGEGGIFAKVGIKELSGSRLLRMRIQTSGMRD